MFPPLLACALALVFSLPLHAATDLPEMTVTAPAGSLTQADVEGQRQALNATAGSVSFVDSEQFKTRYAHTLRDVLKDTPGVFVQNRYGQELRLSIRGSGISRGFHTRGIEALQDGFPTNAADGSGDFYQIDPLALRSVEVYKGGNGLTYGATTLGGAVNFVTPTAHTAIAPNIFRLEAGSFGTLRTNAQLSRVLGNADFLVNGTITHAEGFRNHEITDSQTFNANMGYRFNEDVETRFYLGNYMVNQELPGSLSLNDALNNPRKASATALTGDQARDTRTQRVANRTSFSTGNGTLDLDTWVIHKGLFHPIFQVIDQDGWTYGIAPRWRGEFKLGGNRNELLAGLRFFGGNTVALQFNNVNGSRGAQTLNARQDAYNYEAFLENRHWFHPEVALMTGAKLFYSTRSYHDRGGLPANPTAKEDAVDYTGINPKIGFLWQPREDIQNFIDVVRSQDVPDFSDLNQTIGATQQFVPLKAQDAWTLEAGSRGQHGMWGWDASIYRSWISNELIQFTTGAGVPASTFNAGHTVHQGIELGFHVEMLKDVAAKNDTITLYQLWNWSDFSFQNDPQYGNNRIAGVPEHLLRTSIGYKHASGFYFKPSVDWAPDGAFADHANTLKTPGYAVLNVETGFQFDNGPLLYIEARNLNDERYVSDISTVRDATAVATTIFYPGSGRAFFAGMRYGF